MGSVKGTVPALVDLRRGSCGGCGRAARDGKVVDAEGMPDPRIGSDLVGGDAPAGIGD